jgi:arylsulfatase A-like enzyme
MDHKFGLAQGFQSVEIDIKKHTAAKLVDKAITWLGDDRGQPSFLFLHFFDVHEYRSPAPFSEQFLPRTGAGRHGSLPLPELQRKAMANLFDDLSEADLKYLIGKYDGALRFVDEELGRLFDWLRQQGRYDDTLIIITSDHGEEFWDHGGTGHGFTLYEEQLRVPLIMKPGDPALHDMPLIREANVGVIDIVPTVLDLMDLPLLPFLQGESLVPLMEADKRFPRPILAESTYFRNSAAIIENDSKYIGNGFFPADFFDIRQWFAALRTVYTIREDELFRLDSDPRESANLISEEAATASGMRTEVLAHLRDRESGRQHEMDEETLKQLRSMGYIQ